VDNLDVNLGVTFTYFS